MSKTKGMNQICIDEARTYDSLMTNFIIVHSFAFAATIFREIFSTETSLLGQAMRIMEITMIVT